MQKWREKNVDFMSYFGIEGIGIKKKLIKKSTCTNVKRDTFYLVQ